MEIESKNQRNAASSIPVPSHFVHPRPETGQIQGNRTMVQSLKKRKQMKEETA
jgi:hypothetical protein